MKIQVAENLVPLRPLKRSLKLMGFSGGDFVTGGGKNEVVGSIASLGKSIANPD